MQSKTNWLIVYLMVAVPIAARGSTIDELQTVSQTPTFAGDEWRVDTDSGLWRDAYANPFRTAQEERQVRIETDLGGWPLSQVISGGEYFEATWKVLLPLRDTLRLSSGGRQSAVPQVAVAPFESQPVPESSRHDRILKFPASYDGVAVGGGGRFLIFTLSSIHRLAVVDVAKQNIVKYVDVGNGAICTAGEQKFVVVLPTEKIIQRWDLKTFECELTATLDLPTPDVVVMGSASQGPILIGGGERHQGGFQLLDLDNLQPLDVTIEPETRGINFTIETRSRVRASADGHVFTTWRTGAHVMVVDGLRAKTYNRHDMLNHLGPLTPSADGARIYTWRGVYSPDLQLIDKGPAYHPSSFPAYYPVPAAHGDCFVRVERIEEKDIQRYGKKPTVTIHLAGHNETIATLPQVNIYGGILWDDSAGESIGPDQRVHYIPDHKTLATVTAERDSVAFRHVEIDPNAADLTGADATLQLAMLQPTTPQQAMPAADQMRTWTDATGRFRVRARFLRRDGDKIYLERENGAENVVDLERLSKEDQKYLQGREEKTATRQNEADQWHIEATADQGARIADNEHVGDLVAQFIGAQVLVTGTADRQSAMQGTWAAGGYLIRKDGDTGYVAASSINSWPAINFSSQVPPAYEVEFGYGTDHAFRATAELLDAKGRFVVFKVASPNLPPPAPIVSLPDVERGIPLTVRGFEQSRMPNAPVTYSRKRGQLTECLRGRDGEIAKMAMTTVQRQDYRAALVITEDNVPLGVTFFGVMQKATILPITHLQGLAHPTVREASTRINRVLPEAGKSTFQVSTVVDDLCQLADGYSLVVARCDSETQTAGKQQSGGYQAIAGGAVVPLEAVKSDDLLIGIQLGRRSPSEGQLIESTLYASEDNPTFLVQLKATMRDGSDYSGKPFQVLAR